MHYPLAFWYRKFHVSHPAKNEQDQQQDGEVTLAHPFCR